MAHTFDAKLRFSGAYSPLTSNYTCGSGATVLVLGIVTGGSVLRTGGAPTYNGVALTQADQTRKYTSFPETSCELWYLLDPSTGAAYSISVPNSGSKNLYVVASSYKAASGKTSVLDVADGTTGEHTNIPTVDLTTTVDGDVIVAVCGSGHNTLPDDRSGVILYESDNATYVDLGMYKLQTTAGLWSSWWSWDNGNDYGICVAAFKESTGVVDVTVEPAALALSLSLKTPSIANDADQTVIVSALSLTAELNAPAISGDITKTVTALAGALLLKAPSVTGTAVLSPVALTLALSLKTPSIAIDASQTVVVSALALTATLDAPVVQAPLTSNVRMIPFIFSSSIAYMMEIGNYYARFYYGGQPLLDGAGDHVDITTPYSEDDLFELQTRQLADVMRITHPSYPPAILSRTDPTTFSTDSIEFTKGPFLTRHDLSSDDGITMVCNVAQAGTTGTLIASDDVFESGHAGALFRLTHPRVNLKTEGTKTTTQTGIIGEAIEVYGDYAFSITTSNWSGTVKLQRSTDDWATSTELVSYTNNKRTYTGTETTEGVQYRINVTAHSSGTISATLLVNSSVVSGSLTDDNTGIIKIPLSIKGDFSFVTHGNWDGRVVLERNENGAGWESYRSFISKIVSGAGDYNVRYSGTENADNVQYRINMTVHSSGTIYVDLSADSSTQSGVVKIDSVTSATQAEVTVLSEIGSSTDTKRWAEGAWSDVRGYPTSITFFQDRAIYAGKTGSLPYVWFSKSSDYDNFEEGLKDSDSFALAIPVTNQIAWIEALNDLVFVTEGGNGEQGCITSNKLDYAITPTNFSVRMQTAVGSANIQPVKVKDVILFVDHTKRKILELVYRDAEQKYVAPDLTELAEHITEGGITSIAHQRSPDSILWCTIEDASHLLSMTYNREQDVVSWARHPTTGIFQSVAISPGTVEDELWMSVVRDDSGASSIYIEQCSSRNYGASKSDCFFVDSGITYNGAYTNIIAGLSHLEGKTVAILADGVVYPTQKVSGGTVTLSSTVRKAHVGLPFTSIVVPMPMDLSTEFETTHAAIKKIHRLLISFINTLNAKYGKSETDLYEIVWDTTDLFTGDKAVAFDAGYSRDDYIVISQADPLPCTVRAIVPHLSITG